MEYDELTDKIAEMSTDIKWLISDREEHNEKFDKHVEESDSFRNLVSSHAAWLLAIKAAIGGIVAALGYLVFKR